MSPHGRTHPWVCVSPVRAHSTWLGTVAGPAPRPQVQKSSLGTLPQRGWETCWEVWSSGKPVILLVAGRPCSSPDTSPGTLGPWPDISRVWHIAEACGLGGPALRLPAPHLGRKPASRGSDESHLLGPPPCSSTRKGDGRTVGSSQEWGWDGRVFGFAVT